MFKSLFGRSKFKLGINPHKKANRGLTEINRAK